MAAGSARFVHARAAGAWFSASPRVQRAAAAHILVILAVALTAIAMHPRPGVNAEPLALAAASGPVPARVAVDADRPTARSARASVSRAKTKSRSKPAPAAPTGWAHWSGRIRGCESHGRPDAQPDYKAKNPDSSASGAYQITDATWDGRYGVAHASDATPEQQDAAAAQLYRRHGTADWAASAACWRR